MATSIRRGIARVTLASLALLVLAPTLHAQDSFPSKPVHLLVPFPPGGAVDIVARTLADELGKRWTTNIIIENRPGAGGIIAASGHAIQPFLYPKLPYDVFADFTPITLLGNSPNLALVRADSPIKTLADLIAAARATPGQLSYGHAGNGTSPHLAGELLKVTAKIDITAVPYKGGAPVLNDLLGGHIPLSFNNVPESIAMIRSGSLRPLAVTTAKRSPILPDVPTFDEAGVKGYDTGVWWALLAPAGLPGGVKAKIYRDAADAMKSPAVRERFQTLGAVPVGSTPDEVAALIRADHDKWGPIIKAAGVVAESTAGPAPPRQTGSSTMSDACRRFPALC